MGLERLKVADLAIIASDQQCVSTPSNGSGWAGVLSKLGSACRSCAIIKVEDVQGIVSMTRKDSIAIPSCSHASHIACIWMLI